jgi:hypothetical protein
MGIRPPYPIYCKWLCFSPQLSTDGPGVALVSEEREIIVYHGFAYCVWFHLSVTPLVQGHLDKFCPLTCCIYSGIYSLGTDRRDSIPRCIYTAQGCYHLPLNFVFTHAIHEGHIPHGALSGTGPFFLPFLSWFRTRLVVVLLPQGYTCFIGPICPLEQLVLSRLSFWTLWSEEGLVFWLPCFTQILGEFTWFYPKNSSYTY